MATQRKHPDKPTGIRFDSGLRRWLVEYAAEQDLTVSQVVRRAVLDYRAKVVAADPPSLRRGGAV